MICGFCGHEFDESEGARPGCGACYGGCHGIHCPRCNYINIQEPDILLRLKTMLTGKDKEKKP